MATNVSKAQGIKLFNAALFTQASRNHSFTNMMTGAAPKVVEGQKKGSRKQTEKGAPIVRVTDLEKQAGDKVEVDVFHKLNKLPTMGDRKLEGRGDKLTSASFELAIDQGRYMVDSGGKMAQQRTKHNLLSSAKTLMGSYYNDLDDETTLYHLAGARGDYFVDDSIVPLESHEEFSEIMVNPLTPPTYERRFQAGAEKDLKDLAEGDVLTLAAIEKLALMLDEMVWPIKPVQLAGDDMAKDDPFYVLYVTPRQWHNFFNFTSQKEWLTLIARAQQRSKGWNHPLFKGDCAMWRNILVKKSMVKPVRFNAGSSVKCCKNDNNATVETQQVKAGVIVERALLLGAQALATAYGNAGMGSYFNMHTEKTDHGNSNETSIAWMNGKAKIRFRNKEGKLNDHGVAVLDTSVRDVNKP